jgi:hypothetical protein
MVQGSRLKVKTTLTITLTLTMAGARNFREYSVWKEAKNISIRTSGFEKKNNGNIRCRDDS